MAINFHTVFRLPEWLRRHSSCVVRYHFYIFNFILKTAWPVFIIFFNWSISRNMNCKNLLLYHIGASWARPNMLIKTNYWIIFFLLFHTSWKKLCIMSRKPSLTAKLVKSTTPRSWPIRTYSKIVVNQRKSSFSLLDTYWKAKCIVMISTKPSTKIWNSWFLGQGFRL